MKSAMLGLSLLICAAIAGAKDARVSIAWTRSFPNSSLGIMPDNRGHIAATGTENTNVVALLLNTRGRKIAKQTVPLPGIVSAVADKSGQIFVTGNQWNSRSVYCAAFAPSLSRLLWVEEKNLSNSYSPPWVTAEIGPMVADENGGVYVFGNWGQVLFLSEFRGDNAGLKIVPSISSVRSSQHATAVARSPTGQIYLVAQTSIEGHYFLIALQKFDPIAQELTTYPPFGDFSLPNAATCDSHGNLIIAGRFSDDRANQYSRGRCMTMKMDSQMNILWRAVHGPLDGGPGIGFNIADAVAVDKSDNIIITGNVGTVKYAPEGRVLWEATEIGNTLRLDESGNVLLSRQVGREGAPAECEITKLNSATGTLCWQKRFHDGSAYDNWPSGLMLDKDSNVYFASLNGEQSTIVKLVEHGRGNQK